MTEPWCYPIKAQHGGLAYSYNLSNVFIFLHLEWDEALNSDVRDTHENGPVHHVEGEEEKRKDNPSILFDVTCTATKQGGWNFIKFKSRLIIYCFILV